MPRSKGRWIMGCASVFTGLILFTACSSTAQDAGSVNTGTSASASPSTGATASNSRPEAWVRGTNVTLTNNTGATLAAGSVSGDGDSMPATTETALANGASRAESEEWRTTNGTNVAYRVVYANDDVLEFKVYNPAIGTPGVTWRKGYSVMNWSSDGQYAVSGDETFDENTTQTLQMEGHTVKVSRGGDDGDNKNWTVTLDG